MNSHFFKNRCQSGYALAVTMVFVAIGLTIAAGLAISRQMWGHMGEKQLHRVLTQTAMDADSLAMLSNLRMQVEGDGNSMVSLDSAAFVDRTVLSISPMADDPNGKSAVYQSTTRVAFPDGWAEEGQFPLQANLFYDELEETPTQTALGLWDPFQGVWTVSTGFGVLTGNELVGGVREDKSIKPVRDEHGNWVSGSRLHAWLEVDTAKIHEVAVRRFSATAFTLFVPEIQEVVESMALGTWAGGVSQSQGVGRYYTETAVAPSRQGLVLNYPLVAVGGMNWEDLNWEEYNGYWNLQVSTGVTSGDGGTGESGNSRTIPYVMKRLEGENSPENSYKKYRYTKYAGMLALGGDRPVKLVRFEGQGAMLRGVPSWISPDYMSGSYNVSVSADEPNILAHLWSRADCRILRTTPNVGVAMDMSTGQPMAALAGAVTVDDTAKEIVVNLSAVVLPVRSLVIFVAAGGYDAGSVALTDAERQQYKVRIICPNVDNMGWASSAFNPVGVGGLTIASPHPVIFSNGFNAGGTTVPAMVVAQNFVVSATPGYPAYMKGVFVTVGGQMGTSGNPLESVIQGMTGSVPSGVSIVGSVLLWERMAYRPLVTGYSSVEATLYPDSLYLSGKSFPPAALALLDVRFAREQLRNYRIYSEDTTLTQGGSPTPTPTPSY